MSRNPIHTMRSATGLIRLALVLAICIDLTSASEPFSPGDRVCFVGDSITHGGSYHGNILLFYATRFPSRRFASFNCGVSGGNTNGAIERLSTDILIHQPTVATIMLGMNDVGRQLYAKNSDLTDNDINRAKAIDGYGKSLRTLATQLKSGGARLIFITPSIFDQTAVFSSSDDPYCTQPEEVGVNTGMGLIAQTVRDVAAEFGASLVDFYQPMTSINREQQRHDPSYTLVGKDRIHPGPIGHFVMSYLFLKEQGAPGIVNRVAIDAATGKAKELVNAQLSGLTTDPTSVTFTLASAALPFPVSPDVYPALKLVPFIKDMNQEYLQVTGLESGDYELLIDGELIKSLSSEELTTGINCAELTNTPQYRQAVRVMQINKSRMMLVSDKLRSLVFVEQSYLRGVDLAKLSLEEKCAIIEKNVEVQKGLPWYEYCKAACNKYKEYKPMESDNLRQVETITQEMWAAATPEPHAYLIRQKTK